MEQHQHLSPLDIGLRMEAIENILVVVVEQLHRLEAIEYALEDLETTLVVLVERFNQFAALYRTDHYGVGRGGVQEEGA